METDPLQQTRTSIPDLLNGLCVHGRIDSSDYGDSRRAASDCDECVRRVMDELSARDAEIARLRAVLEWAATILPKPCCASCGQNVRNVMEAAVNGDWPAVRAAGVALPGGKE